MWYLRWALRLPHGNWFSFRAFYAAAPLVLAAYVAVSRVRDRKHDTIDITAGAAIGIGAAILAYLNFHSGRYPRDYVLPPAAAAAGYEPLLLKQQRRRQTEGLADMYNGGVTGPGRPSPPPPPPLPTTAVATQSDV